MCAPRSVKLNEEVRFILKDLRELRLTQGNNQPFRPFSILSGEREEQRCQKECLFKHLNDWLINNPPQINIYHQPLVTILCRISTNPASGLPLFHLSLLMTTVRQSTSSIILLKTRNLFSLGSLSSGKVSVVPFSTQFTGLPWVDTKSHGFRHDEGEVGGGKVRKYLRIFGWFLTHLG